MCASYPQNDMFYLVFLALKFATHTHTSHNTHDVGLIILQRGTLEPLQKMMGVLVRTSLELMSPAVFFVRFSITSSGELELDVSEETFGKAFDALRLCGSQSVRLLSTSFVCL